MKIHRTWLAPMTALAFGLMTSVASAQGGGPGGGGGGGGFGAGGFAGGGGGFGGFNGDPAQMRQQIQDMMMQGYRDQLEITNDDEWNVIKERVVKVMEAQQEATGAGGLGGMARMFGRGRGGGGGGGGRGMASILGGNPMPEQEALQTAVDAKATAEQLKDKLEKYRAARKAREDKLAAARKELRALLSQRQEVEAVLGGLLD